MSKGIITVLGHTIEYNSGNVIIDTDAEETLHDMIASAIEYHEIKKDVDDIELEDEKGNLLMIPITWKIINPEADKWKEMAEKLYKRIFSIYNGLAQNCYNESSKKDLIDAVEKYEQLIKEENGN